MRLTVSQQIVAGLGTLISISVLAFAITYDGMSRVHAALRELAEVKEPVYSTTLEIELNVNAVVMATIAYIGTLDPDYRRVVERDHADLARFHGRYLKLAGSETERGLAERLLVQLAELRELTDDVMASRDRQATAWTQVTRNFERADSIIDLRLQPAFAPTSASANALRDLATSLAEVGVALSAFQRTQEPDPRTLVAANAEEFRATLARFRSLPLQPREAAHGVALDSTFAAMMRAIWPVLDAEQHLQSKRGRLLQLHAEMDDLLDDEIQTLAYRQLYEPRRAAEAVAAEVLRHGQLLAPLLLALTVLIALVLIRSIVRPVRALKHGAAAVGRGDLDHRIRLRSRDEFADVAAEFNRMVEQLQATTVSKELLQRSEAQLRRAVARLQDEIAERHRAEEERRRLAVSLQRSETMSAMGALVGGVAHEVRNPLFGILSVLEAMESRFGAAPDHQRYLEVLRDQAERLNRLMRELLEYGKPPAGERRPASLAGVLAEAAATARPAAERAGVRLRCDIAEDPAPICLDRNRLLRVFLNLLDNAVQHTPAGGRVTLASRVVADEAGGWIECSVEDTGPGFRAEDLPRVFDPFFTRRRGGTGLGLSIVQRIVEEHGGQVVAGNGAAGGIMTVRLPARVPASIPFAAAGQYVEA